MPSTWAMVRSIPIASSVDGVIRPPMFRSTSASPGSRPSKCAGSTRGSRQLMTIVPSVGINGRPEMKCCSAKSWFRSIRVSKVLMVFLFWLLFCFCGQFCDHDYRVHFDVRSKSSPQIFTRFTGGQLKLRKPFVFQAAFRHFEQKFPALARHLAPHVLPPAS